MVRGFEFVAAPEVLEMRSYTNVKRLIRKGPGDRAPAMVRKRGRHWVGHCFLCGWGAEALNWKPMFWGTCQHVLTTHTYNMEGP